jgi:hypothetical protein
MTPETQHAIAMVFHRRNTISRVVPFGTTQLNVLETRKLAETIAGAGYKRREEAMEACGWGSIGRSGRSKAVKRYYNSTYCSQPHSACECPFCDLLLEVCEKLNLCQESAWKLAEALKREISEGGIWMSNMSVLELFSPRHFVVARPARKGKMHYVLPFDINSLPPAYVVDESLRMTRWGLSSLLDDWKGSFSLVRDLLLDAICARKAPISYPARLIQMFAATCQSRGETVAIHVRELRGRTGERRLGDLLKIVYSIGPEWIETDEEFDATMSMKMIASSSPRIQFICKTLLKSFNSLGKRPQPIC